MFSERAREKPKQENSSLKQIVAFFLFFYIQLFPALHFRLDLHQHFPVQMKPSLLISLLLLSLLLFHAQGIRLGRDLASLVGHQKLPDQGVAASQVKHEIDSVGNKKKRASRASKRSRDSMFPSIHEDYYGPRHHRPRHHKH